MAAAMWGRYLRSPDLGRLGGRGSMCSPSFARRWIGGPSRDAGLSWLAGPGGLGAADEPAAKRARTEPREEEVIAASKDSLGLDSIERWNDKELEAQPITSYQAREYRRVLAGVKKTKNGGHFKVCSPGVPVICDRILRPGPRSLLQPSAHFRSDLDRFRVHLIVLMTAYKKSSEG